MDKSLHLSLEACECLEGRAEARDRSKGFLKK